MRKTVLSAFLLIVVAVSHAAGLSWFELKKHEPESDVAGAFNIRYNTALGLCTNFTLQADPSDGDMFASHLQSGIGSGGFNLGIGTGMATGILMVNGYPLQEAGWGVRLEYMKTWDDKLFGGKDDLIGKKWLGVEFSFGLFGVVDIGYFASWGSEEKDHLFTFGIGLMF